ncbi:MAG: UMP kinase [Planctomycetota bacterium]|nr:MAG: UMP kinase [Planctomycetota bacterium]
MAASFAEGRPSRRILLKVSGEGFSREGETSLDTEQARLLAEQLKTLTHQGVEVACVIGGGNILRGGQAKQYGLARATADYMGMLATVINGLALCDALEAFGQPARVMSAIDVHKVCEPFIRRRAIRHLEKGRVVILVGGLGSPFFTTDTTAAQRGAELDCDLLMKLTMVDGVYDRDPKKHEDAVLFKDLTYEQVLQRQLRVMDQTAFAMCRENDLPIVVFNMHEPEGVVRVAQGERVGTLIQG